MIDYRVRRADGGMVWIRFEAGSTERDERGRVLSSPEFAEQLARWRDAAKVLSPAELVRQVLEESGYNAMLAADRSPESAGRADQSAAGGPERGGGDRVGGETGHVA